MHLNGLLILLVQFLACAVAKSSLPLGTLVLYDPKVSGIEQYSKFIEYLKQEHGQLEVKEVSDQGVSLFRNGIKVYQNLIILPTKLRTLAHDLTSSALLDFVNDGGDVLTISNEDALSETVRGFVNQLGIYPSPKSHQLVDHFQNIDDDYKLIKIEKENLIDNSIIEEIPKNFKYSGSTALISNNAHLIPILQAPTTSFTKDFKNEEINWTIGKEGYLTVAHQSLNNARSIWFGDDSILKDLSFDENKLLISNLIDWTFQIKNVIKFNKVNHSHSDGTTYEERPYKIKDDIIYEISLSKWDGSKWGPFDTNDIQVDIKLLDPYHRLTLEKRQDLEDSTIYGINFKLPDHHGVFSFHTDYKRSGYSYIDNKVILSIRHLANDEYPRSWEITNSWVYVSSIVAVLVSWFIFVLGFIFIKDKQTTTDKKDK